MAENNHNDINTEELQTPVHESFLEKIGRKLLPVLTVLRVGSGSSLRLLILAIFFIYLLFKEIVKWQLKVVGG